MVVRTSTDTPAEDWFDQAVRKNLARERARHASRMSGAWSRRRFGENQVADLRSILQSVRAIVRIHGVPRECRVMMVVLGESGAGAAGFEMLPERFEKPFILLDPLVYETCPPGEVLDVYCGIGLHEAGHIRHTRDGYLRAAGDLSRVRLMFENIMEDERIEEIICLESEGFAPYIHAAKNAILECGEIGQALSGWDELPDMDRVNLLIAAFVRMPQLIDERKRTWTAVGGECIFEALRTLLPRAPLTEDDVARYAELLEQLRERLRKRYADLSRGMSDAEPPAGEESDERRRLRRQALADEEDRAAESQEKPADDAQPPSSETMKRIMEELSRRSDSGRAEEARKRLARALKAKAAARRSSGRTGRRFGVLDLERMLESSTSPRTTEKALEASSIEAGASETGLPGDAWNWGKTRRTVIEYPRATDADQARYKPAVGQVRPHIAAMRAVFQGRPAERRWQERERRTGRIDGRRLARPLFSDRIFKQTRTRPARKIAVGLLLDESGSMGRGSGSRTDRALQACAMVVEALRTDPAIELEVYAHSSCGEESADCLVRYLFGRKNHDAGTIGSYVARHMNYDHQALLTAARLFQENTTSNTRILLVLSDGMPEGTDYGGAPAVRATQDAVQAVRRRGIDVLSVAIADMRNEEIYGKEHVVKFTSLEAIVPGVRAVVTKIMRRLGPGVV
jgi:hypothetical protein